MPLVKITLAAPWKMELPWVKLQNWLSKPFTSWVQLPLAATGSVEVSHARAVGKLRELLFPPCRVLPLFGSVGALLCLGTLPLLSSAASHLSSPIRRARMWGQNRSVFSGRRLGPAVLTRDALAPCWPPRIQGE